MLIAANKLARLTDLEAGAVAAFAELCSDVEHVDAHGSIVAPAAASDAASDGVIVMLAGWAVRCQALGEERRQITALLLPGDMLDVRPVPFAPLDYAVVAAGPAHFARVSREALEDMLQDRPSLAKACRASEAIEGAIVRGWLSRLGRRDALGRVAHFLCEIWARARWAGLIVDGELTFPMSQLMIADATGLTPIHVNRTLQALRADGLIRLSGKTLVIPDFGRLAAASDFHTPWLVDAGERASKTSSAAMISAECQTVGAAAR